MGADSSCTISSDAHPEDESPIIRAPEFREFASSQMMSRFPDIPQIGTIYELFEWTKSIAPDNPYYAHRVYENGVWLERWDSITRTEFAEDRDAVGGWLIGQARLKFEDKVGILSYNRIEWVVAQHACWAYGFIPVPIYDTFGWENIGYILKHSEVKVIFVISTKLELLAGVLEGSYVTDLVVIDNEEHPYNELNRPDVGEVRIHRFADVVKCADRFSKRPPTPETPASIMYTSGTTGHPKGCMITHSNFMSVAACFYSSVYTLGPTDSMLSYLPLAHVYEAVLHIVAMKVVSGCMYFYSGSIPRLIDEIRLVKPTVFIGVSRVFERISDGIQAKIAQKPFLVRSLFNAAFAIKSHLSGKFRIQHVPILDKVFGSVQAALGGEMRLMISGGAALSPETQNFLRIACNVSFIQGYGLTESTAGTTVQKARDTANGNVGVLLQCTEAKLKSLPDQGYLAKDWSGELLLRGPSIFKGYYKDEEATRQVFDNGWLKTGDVFKLLPTGQFVVVSRCKDLVKLSQGEYVSLAKLESIYMTCKYVAQIYIHAGMLSRFLVAIVVLDKEHPGYDNVSKEDMLKILDEKATEVKLNGFERIKQVHLTTDQFTPQNGLMTPSLKLCYFKIAKAYEKEIALMEKEVK